MAPKNNDAQPELTDAQLKVISSFKKFTKCLDEVNFGEEKSSKYTYKWYMSIMIQYQSSCWGKRLLH